MDGELSQDLILLSLLKFFSQFVINYHMNKLNTTLSKLLNMLKIVESHFKSDKANLLLVDKKKKMAKGKGSKKNKKLNPKGRNFKRKKVRKVFKDDTCFHCDKQGHWKKDYKSYLASMKPDTSATSKGFYMIQTIFLLSALTFNSWVLDTTYGSHICKSLQDQHKIKSLKEGDFVLHGANEESIQAEAVGTYYLFVSIGKTIVLRDCYYMPNVIKKIISISMLLRHDYEIRGKSNSCLIFLSNGLFILPHNDNIFMVDKNKKRKRENDNITYLRHY